MSRHDRVLASALDAIGDTPLVELTRLGRELDGRILAKLEYLNPGFSKKDRIARQIVEDAEADGRLRPGQTVVELTSGNTGTGLAIVCGIKGYPFVAVMSKGNSMERARMMRALGAKVVLVDQMPGSMPGQVSGQDLALVEEEAQRIVQARGAFRADQFRLAGNTRTCCTRVPRSCDKRAGDSTPSAISSAPAEVSPAAPRRSSGTVHPSGATWWNRRARPP
jgi:cysteine synthase A